MKVPALALVLVLGAGCDAGPREGRGAEGAPGDEQGGELAESVPLKYAWLFDAMISNEEVDGVLAGLPYDRIELEDFSTWRWGGDRITFWRDGRAELDGEGGLRCGRVNPFDFGRLCYLIEDHALAGMQPSYRWDGFDAGTETVRVWPSGGTALEVEDYGGVGPIDLWAIQRALDGVARTVRWEPCDGGAGGRDE